ncbi:VWA domain-containing protein [Desulfopila aestuarii]|uniref:Ca-activated chloride channel family protein n=1 Tax=Desulfopila aestuarii DSM 18488 TaxID=1121416 RepID=A0A1M7YEY2_9BACT|nr:VWA domain-containing protein [Desulfopila aestuarii]SHO51212.1 Ca-activated chloride channel family protein [Desulfopila aestuarii DSM 18488]
MLIFAYPWLLFLAPLPWLIRMLLPPRREKPVALRVPFGDRIQAATLAGSSVSQVARSKGQLIFKIFLWLLVLVALARPQLLEPPVTKELPTRDLLLLVDLSSSMSQEDFTNAREEKVDRLTAVKEVLGDFLSQRQGDRVGLVVFGDAPFLQTPFTIDLDLSRQLLDEAAIGMAGPRTAFGDAIGLGLTLFAESDAPAKTIIALTDGNDTASQVPPVEASRVAMARGIRIHTVAIGDPTTIGEDKLDEETLRNVAETAGGKYFFAGDRKQLAGIYAELDKIETRQVDTISHRPTRDLYYWVLLLLLIASLGEKTVLVLRRSRSKAAMQKPGRVYVDHLTGRLEVQR